MSSTCDTIHVCCESHDVYMQRKLVQDIFDEGPVVDRLKAAVSLLHRTQLLVDSISISTYTPQYFQSRQVTGHSRLSRTCLFYYLGWPYWTVSSCRLRRCSDCLLCSLWPLSFFIPDELLVHRCVRYLCLVNVALTLIEQRSRLRAFLGHGASTWMSLSTKVLAQFTPQLSCEQGNIIAWEYCSVCLVSLPVDASLISPMRVSILAPSFFVLFPL